ncbi:MAG: acetyl-CoA carboxylase biotin carboxyl carrier protein [Ignavibacteria bacterium]|nr:acetyl-CoA carboxylase biotin carboxyl carrier protein [Ignavibacteria bacterium]
MDLQYVQELLKIFDESSATELSVEENGVKVSVSRRPNEIHHAAPAQHYFQPPYSHPHTPAHTVAIDASPASPSVPAKTDAPAPAPTANTHQILSPIVGTFYRSSSPDAPSYIQVGDTVTVGKTLCIVEAMKLMNEIESDVSGTVIKVLVENGQPVEYHQPMFLIQL